MIATRTISRNDIPRLNTSAIRKRKWIRIVGEVSTYQYDCFDRRISKQVDSAPSDGLEAPVTWFAYDGANVRLEFVDPDGSGAVPAVLTTRYFNGLGVDNIIAQENYAGSPYAVGAYWHIKNHLGSTTDLVAADGDGGHKNHIVYDSYGNVASQSNASYGSRYMYTGREYDAETGLQYYRARYYDSSTGRFLSEDPISFAAGPNQYGYVGGNPIRFTDPFGLFNLQGEGTGGSISSAPARPGPIVRPGWNMGNPTINPVLQGYLDFTGSAASGMDFGLGDMFGYRENQGVNPHSDAYKAGKLAPILLGLRRVPGNENVVPCDNGIKQIENYLKGLGNFPYNDAMINRLKAAAAEGRSLTGADRNFYLHELAESSMVSTGTSQEAAHQRALEIYNVDPSALYHPDVIRQHPAWFNNVQKNYWGIR